MSGTLEFVTVGGTRQAAVAAFLALALVCGLLVFAGIGHGLHDSMGDDGAVAAGVGVCLVLFTLLAPLAALPPMHRRTAVPARSRAQVRVVASPAPAPIARASPSWLQRFLN